MSAAWLESLASECRVAGAAGLFALTYDGRIHCSPEEPGDDDVRQLVNEHQRGDKGFGPALGPPPCAVAAECFGALGYSVEREASDWHLEPDAAELQRQLIEGWSRAAVQMAPDRSAFIREWTDRRLAHVLDGPFEAGRRPRGSGGVAAGLGRYGSGGGVRQVGGEPPAHSIDAAQSRRQAGTCGVGPVRSQSNSTSPPMRNTR